MQRVVIIGSAGTGKTRLSVELGTVLGLPVVHLDTHYWKPGWVQSDPEDWKATVTRLLQKPQWIMDGNYGGTMDMRVAAADTVVFLSIPRVVCLYRVVLRSLRHWRQTRPDLNEGCPEQLPDWEFLKWIWTYPKSKTPKIMAMLESHKDDKTVVILRSSREVKQFMTRVQGAETNVS